MTDPTDELNDFFMAWAEQVANTRTHAETKQPPIERFLAHDRPIASRVSCAVLCGCAAGRASDDSYRSLRRLSPTA